MFFFLSSETPTKPRAVVPPTSRARLVWDERMATFLPSFLSRYSLMVSAMVRCPAPSGPVTNKLWRLGRARAALPFFGVVFQGSLRSAVAHFSTRFCSTVNGNAGGGDTRGDTPLTPLPPLPCGDTRGDTPLTPLTPLTPFPPLPGATTLANFGAVTAWTVVSPFASLPSPGLLSSSLVSIADADDEEEDEEDDDEEGLPVYGWIADARTAPLASTVSSS